MSEQSLLPCPFCGKQPQVEVFGLTVPHIFGVTIPTATNIWCCVQMRGISEERTIQEWNKRATQLPPEREERLQKAIHIAIRFGGICGDHHKAWVIDQMVRALAGDKYEQVVKDAKAGDDGPDTYDWDVGIPP